MLFFIFLHHIEITGEDVLDFFDKTSGILSAVIIILIFIWERKINKKERINESLVNWYLNVLIERNIQKIDSFFEQLEIFFIEDIKVSQNNLFLEDEDINFGLKLDYIKKFDDLKENFNIQFLTIVSSLDSELYSICLNKINEVEDTVKSHIDKTFSGELNGLNRLKISQLKAEFYNILYKPIEKIHKT
ncbi:hypothetical protein MMU07_12540 [Aquiflexum sp. LQ15W]|uniref:hypothetical protein n=1 Tax=Cognataquiflexum nitidum TaxID=2922272 RepID=UPI001F146FAC|nr:hypothetical protein [Cognataquiflexum nitidum]MCH6200410.1 hypothetical protein [Cognataquiflexum nitidum]